MKKIIYLILFLLAVTPLFAHQPSIEWGQVSGKPGNLDTDSTNDVTTSSTEGSLPDDNIRRNKYPWCGDKRGATLFCSVYVEEDIIIWQQQPG